MQVNRYRRKQAQRNNHKFRRVRNSEADLSCGQGESGSAQIGMVDHGKLRHGIQHCRETGQECFMHVLPGQLAKSKDCLHAAHESLDHADDGVDLDGCVCHNGRHIHPSSLFPAKLHVALQETEQQHFDHIISWATHGKCFMIHKRSEFVRRVLPK
jgi:HSF-type DNA-binding